MTDRDELRRTIGQRVKLARTMLGLTQVSMAERCGVGVGTVSEVESGKTMISVEFLFALYKEYKVEPVWLLSGDGETFGSLKVSNPEEERRLLERLEQGLALLGGIVSERKKRYEE